MIVLIASLVLVAGSCSALGQETVSGQKSGQQEGAGEKAAQGDGAEEKTAAQGDGAEEKTAATLERLMEAHSKADEKELSEIAAGEKQLVEVDQSLKEMRARANTGEPTPSDFLDRILKAVKKKTELSEFIKKAKADHEAASVQRQAEMTKLKNELLIQDIEKFKEISESEYGSQLGAIAWKTLVEQYLGPDADIGIGNIAELVFKAKYKGITTSVGIKFVLIPQGTFTMGSPSGKQGGDLDERQHQVTITRPFYLQATEVTQELWRDIMEYNPAYFKGCGGSCPVERVSFDEVMIFIRKLNEKEGKGKYRLPTESEWEYACRAGSTTELTNGRLKEMECGQDENLVKVGWYCGNSNNSTHPVGKLEPNAWGLYDMHGNVWEWCSDWYGPYPEGIEMDPTGPDTGRHKVVRGGGWWHKAAFCRSANRFKEMPNEKSYSLGFRLAMDM